MNFSKPVAQAAGTSIAIDLLKRTLGENPSIPVKREAQQIVNRKR